MPFRAVSLGYPTEVEAWTSGINKESYPLKSKIRFEFPARKGTNGEELGCVAMQVGKKLEWDGQNMKAQNAPKAAQFVKRDYRKGWEI